MNKEQFEQLCRKEHVNPATPEPCWFHPNKPMPHCGYTEVRIDGIRGYVHVFAHRLFNGEIPEGHQVDHTCNPKDGTWTNRSCCNPAHLEAVTPRQNANRAEPASRTHCPQGHEYTEENTIKRTRIRRGFVKTTRECRECRNEYFRKINPGRRDEYKDRQAEYQKRYRDAHKDKINERQLAKYHEARKALLDSLSKPPHSATWTSQ